MYDIDMKRRRELASAVCGKFNAAGIREPNMYMTETSEYTVASGFGQELLHLPPRNLLWILNKDFTTINNHIELKEMLTESGLLKFSPFLQMNFFGQPVLTLTTERHLLLSAEDGFVLAGTPEGKYTYAKSFSDIKFLHESHFPYDSLWRNSLLVNMLCYAAAIAPLFTVEGMGVWFDEYYEIFDRFVHDSFKFYGMDLTFSWTDFKQCIYYTEWWETDARNLYRVMRNNGVIGEAAWGRDTIQIRTVKAGESPKVLTVRIPAADEGILCCNNIPNIVWDTFVNTLACPHEEFHTDTKLLTLMALALSGIHVSDSEVTADSELICIEPTYSDVDNVVDCLGDIYNSEPDAF